MIEDLLRVIGVASIGLILLLPSGDYLNKLYDRNIQIAVALVVVCSILFVDPIFGGLLGLTVFIWYFKMNHRTMMAKTLSYGSSSKNDIYGTPQNLEDAQTNVVNENMMQVEMIGFDGVHGEQVIGAQGLDKTMPGFDKNNSYVPSPL